MGEVGVGRLSHGHDDVEHGMDGFSSVRFSFQHLPYVTRSRQSVRSTEPELITASTITITQPYGQPHSQSRATLDHETESSSFSDLSLEGFLELWLHSVRPQ